METCSGHSWSPRQQDEGSAEQVTDEDTTGTSKGLRLNASATRESREHISTGHCSSLNPVDLGYLANSSQQQGSGRRRKPGQAVGYGWDTANLFGCAELPCL